MRLRSIYEDHWQPISNHPGKLGKKDKRSKKNDMSFLVHPEDRKRWLKWFGGKKIKENLDDQDEFGTFARQEVANNIEKLRYIVAENPNNKNAATLLRSMERLYLNEFGQPYNPPSAAPRI